MNPWSAAVPRRGASKVFCTIATSSHLPLARACLNSLVEHNPEVALALLLLDEAGTLDLPPGVTVLAAGDCAAATQLESMRGRYTQAELCFALKPYLIEALFERGAQQVHYFDADCFALASATALVTQLDAAPLLLTPHCLSPLADDGRRPRPLTLLRAGVFNAGYIGVRDVPQGRAFTRWLASMTLKHARNAPKEGMCGDQRWLDLVPVLFPDAAICRHPGANVGYWNLHERPLRLDAAGHFTAEDRALIFFHFSGYDLARPEQLSRYQDRHALSPGSPLQRLVEIYRAILAAAGARIATDAHSKRGRGALLDAAQQFLQKQLRPE